MADVYEKNLSQKTTLGMTDYIRVVGSDNVSYKQLVSDVANKIITQYTGASLAGSNRSVKSALDALNSNFTIEQLPSCASLSEVSSALDAKLDAMKSSSVAQIRIQTTASFDPFTTGVTYWGEIRRSGTTTYSSVILYGLGSAEIIFGYRNTTGWFFNTVTLS